MAFTQPQTEISTRKCFWEVERGRCVRLNLTAICGADCLDTVGSSTPHNRVALVRTYVSEERSASVIRVTIGEHPRRRHSL
jgi:hypothetical protein